MMDTDDQETLAGIYYFKPCTFRNTGDTYTMKVEIMKVEKADDQPKSATE